MGHKMPLGTSEESVFYGIHSICLLLDFQLKRSSNFADLLAILRNYQ